jgi:hypothetical protein
MTCNKWDSQVQVKFRSFCITRSWDTWVIELLLNPLVEWVVVFIPINYFVGKFKWDLSIFFFVFAQDNWFYGFVTTIHLSLCPIGLRSLGSILFVIYHIQFSLCIVLPGFVWALCCSIVFCCCNCIDCYNIASRSLPLLIN